MKFNKEKKMRKKNKKKINSKKIYCNAKGREILKRKIKKSKKLTDFVFLLLDVVCTYYSLQLSRCFDGNLIELLRFF